MKFEAALTEGILLKRHKRFLADVALNKNEKCTIYCPNTGTMHGCAVLGSRVWFSTSDNPRRKYAHTWELVEVDGGYLVGINTARSNELIIEAIKNGIIQELQGYIDIRTDVPYGTDGSRFDLLLEGSQVDSNSNNNSNNNLSEIHRSCYVKVKNVNMGDEIHRGFFPDTPSDIESTHIRELIQAKRQGHRAVLFFCVQHTGIDKVFPADHLDKEFGKILRQAIIEGVEVIAYRVEISLTEISLKNQVPVIVPARMSTASRSV